MYNALKEIATIVTLTALIGTPIGLWYMGDLMETERQIVARLERVWRKYNQQAPARPETPLPSAPY